MATAKTMQDFVSAAKSQIQEVEIVEVEALLNEGYQVLDVREPVEFAAGTINGALNIPRGILEAAADHVIKKSEEMQDRDKKWLLFCASSARSSMATMVLQQMGFKHVKNINGGMKAWKDAEMNIVTPI